MIATIIGFVLFVIILIIDLLTCGFSESNSYHGGISEYAGNNYTNDSNYTNDKIFKVFSFNIEYGAESFSTDVAAQIIKDTDADLIAIQEASTKPANIDASEEIAKKLSYHHMYFPINDTAIISKYPIEKIDTNLACIVKVNVDDSDYTQDSYKSSNHSVYFISAHFSDFPYQPNQVMNIPYCTDKSGKTVCQKPYSHELDEYEIIRGATTARGDIVDKLLELACKLKETATVIIAGDFNEPSHLDWTARAAEAGIHPKEIRYPTSRKFLSCNFIDTYRAVYSDEVKDPGYTWPTQDPGYPFRNDRIDFIYVGGPTIDREKIKSCDIVKTPSDHYAILSSFTQ